MTFLQMVFQFTTRSGLAGQGQETCRSFWRT
jgi:hypothetical protein